MKALKNTIAEMGVSIGCYSAATLTLGTVTLIGSLAFQGVIWWEMDWKELRNQFNV
jgi:hypothetical protein